MKKDFLLNMITSNKNLAELNSLEIIFLTNDGIISGEVENANVSNTGNVTLKNAAVNFGNARVTIENYTLPYNEIIDISVDSLALN